ncbi:hypothetical protein D8I35_05425 [Corticibacter populi]|uniref:Uncharacterized protein n=1 Tax=Corticibacter populi TaxID=1550736 RepID=A0A3M6QZS5_9BURK|nr:hypothetical protein [Corticibacter populi]RMX08517.1 hypothetical protein D8I35_05425 [Corticibacter populi]
MSNSQQKINEAVIATLQRHEAELQAMKALAAALVATHPDHPKLLDSYLEQMDAIADALDSDAIPRYRAAIHFFQALMLAPAPGDQLRPAEPD